MKKIQIKFKHPKHGYLRLVVRKTINGNIIVKDHNLMDIYIIPSRRKILSVPKDEVNDDLYNAQQRLFKFAGNKGVIDINSVQSGSIYGSIECLILNNDGEDGDFVQIALFTIGRYLEEEKKMRALLDSYYEELDDMWTDPDFEDSTELGEVPHADKQGSMGQRIRPYGMSNRMMEGRFYDYRANMKDCIVCEAKNSAAVCGGCKEKIEEAVCEFDGANYVKNKMFESLKVLPSHLLTEKLQMFDTKNKKNQLVLDTWDAQLLQRVCMAVGKNDWAKMFDYNDAETTKPLPELIRISGIMSGLVSALPEAFPEKHRKCFDKFSNWVHTLNGDASARIS
jgi:hypothetical protein